MLFDTVQLKIFVGIEFWNKFENCFVTAYRDT